MTAPIESSGLLILPHLRVQNANAISSPLTHGFPSMTAFVGLMWALQRKLGAHDSNALRFDGVGVICHHYDEQTTEGGYVKAFRLTRNPVEKDGGTAAIVEEGRIHLDVTLVFGVRGVAVDAEENDRDACAQAAADAVSQLRIAGGSILPHSRPGYWTRPRLLPIPEAREDIAPWFRQLRRRWLPGFALVGRDDLLARTLEELRSAEPAASVLDAWLHLSRLNMQPVHPAPGADPKAKVEWRREPRKGWLVPIPVGYATLEEHAPGSVANARDPNVPFRFVESLYSIGEWVGAHRIGTWRDLLWSAEHDAQNRLYRVRNAYVELEPNH